VRERETNLREALSRMAVADLSSVLQPFIDDHDRCAGTDQLITEAHSVQARRKQRSEQLVADVRSHLPHALDLAMVFSNVGAAFCAAMAAISALCFSIAVRNAGRKCSGRMRSKGGTWNGVVHCDSSGFPGAAGPAAWTAAGRTSHIQIGNAIRARIIPA